MAATLLTSKLESRRVSWFTTPRECYNISLMTRGLFGFLEIHLAPLDAKNMFVGEERHQILRGSKTLFCPTLGQAGVMSPEESCFGKVLGLWTRLCEYKGESSLGIAMPTSIKAMDPFLRIRKKIGSMVNLDSTRQTALAVTGSGEEEAQASRRGLLYRKGRERVL